MDDLFDRQAPPGILIVVYMLHGMAFCAFCGAMMFNIVVQALQGGLFLNIMDSFTPGKHPIDIPWGLMHIGICIGWALAAWVLALMLCCLWTWVYRAVTGRHLPKRQKSHNRESGIRFSGMPAGLQVLVIYGFVLEALCVWNGIHAVLSVGNACFSDDPTGITVVIGVFVTPVVAIVAVVLCGIVAVFCGALVPGWLLCRQMLQYMFPVQTPEQNSGYGSYGQPGYDRFGRPEPGDTDGWRWPSGEGEDNEQ